jgi:hypothetical protein
VVDAHEEKTEILAVCRNVIVAKAAFTAASSSAPARG